MAWKYNPAQIDSITRTRGLDMSTAEGSARPSARCFHTGGKPSTVTTDGTDLSIVVTELYVAEVFVPVTLTVTGISLHMGSATEGSTTTGTKVMLFNAAGTRLVISPDIDVSAFTVDNYGDCAFTTPYTLPGPGTYYVGVISGVNTNRINTHVMGRFGAGKVTGLVYATESGYATITPPTTFTTGLGPIATLY